MCRDFYVYNQIYSLRLASGNVGYFKNKNGVAKMHCFTVTLLYWNILNFYIGFCHKIHMILVLNIFFVHKK